VDHPAVGALKTSLLTFLVLALSVAVTARVTREMEQEIQAQKSELQALRKQLSEGRRKVKELEGQTVKQAESVAQIRENERLGKLVLERLDAAQERYRKLLIASQEDLGIAQENLTERRQLLAKRVRRIWMRGRPNPGLAWLGQDNPEAWLKRRKAFQAIVNEDKRLLGQVKERGEILSERVDDHKRRVAGLAEVEAAKSEELAALGQSRQGEEIKLARLQDKAEAERTRLKQLEASQAAIEQLLRSLERRRQEEEKRYKEAQAAAKKENEKRAKDRKERDRKEKERLAQEKLREKDKPADKSKPKPKPPPLPEPEPDIVVARPPPSVPQGAAPARSGMCWPVRGKILSRFGLQKNAVLGTTTRNLGIEVTASQGQPVVSASGGQVAAILHLPGRGTTVVIEHPGGYFTLYGHLSKVLVREGASVTPCKQIALAGSEESNSGAMLYFELRKGLSALDPLEWLTR
jgi:septal ring factor EnvC (AmiA/AmiB activator)